MGYSVQPFPEVQHILWLESFDASPFREMLAHHMAEQAVEIHQAYGVEDFRHRLHREKMDLAVIHLRAQGVDNVPALIESLQSGFDPRQFLPIVVLVHGEDEKELLEKVTRLSEAGVAGFLRTQTTLPEQALLLLQLLNCKRHYTESREVKWANAQIVQELDHLVKGRGTGFEAQPVVLGKAHLHCARIFAPIYQGDHLVLRSLGEGRWLFAVLDLHGKGMVAMRRAAVLEGIICGAITCGSVATAGELLAQINQAWRDSCNANEPQLAKAILAVVDTEKGILQVASAGQPLGFLLNAERGVEALGSAELPGLPLGTEDALEYGTATVNLHEGDRAVFFTNGIWDQKLSGENMLSYNSFVNQVQELAPLKSAALLEKLFSFWRARMEGNVTTDDATVLILEF
ncbi:MAG: PP2C family protein-serine/threonine phosphatase [Candidatus Sumerlaeia bacterium]|nr:PP2C family protein-serine/threonine phosphatase [Candidatus Sumerlaeia bacterium]